MQTTLLVYMANHNNLENFAIEEIERIKEYSYDIKMNVVVQYGREYGIEVTTIRSLIKDGEEIETDLGVTNTGDPNVLKSFIEEATKEYPADKTILILWSHGSGIDDIDIYDEKIERKPYFVPVEEIEEIAFGHDVRAKDFLDNLELQKALDVSVKIDVLGFDACLMGMIEILYQLRHQTEVMVASQHLEPALGWDYAQILQKLDVEKTAMEIGEQMVSFHHEYHALNEREEVTQSALDTTVIDEVVKDLDSFALVLREELKKGDAKENGKALKVALQSSQPFERSDYIDLVDLVNKIENRLEFEPLKPYSVKLLKSLEKLIVANHYQGYFMKEVNGLSIYFPYEQRAEEETFLMYEKLDFAKDCPNWIKLLKWYRLCL